MDSITATAAVFLKTGLILEVPDRTEDFWLFLGERVGWGRFSWADNKVPMHSPTGFELVEVLPAEHVPAPSPRVSIEHVLWRRREAIEAELTFQKIRADWGHELSEIPQCDRGSLHES